MAAKKSAGKTAGKTKKGGAGGGLFVYLFLFGALATYSMPAVRLTFPTLGEKSWSPQELTKGLPKLLAPKKKKESPVDIHVDFFDLLNKIAPKDEFGRPRKISVSFVLGALVPVALISAYAAAVLTLLLFSLSMGPFIAFSAAAAGCSVYALAGTYYLGLAAHDAFEKSIQHAGIFGSIAKSFTHDFTVRPDAGLYLLAGFTLVALFVLLQRSK